LMKTSPHADFRFLQCSEAVFFDLDGCIYHTDQPASGAGELVELLQRQGKKVGFITNNSRQTAVEIEKKLLQMGLRIQEEQIFTATEAIGWVLKQNHGCMSVKVVGSSSLERSIEQHGHTLVDLFSPEPADVVAIGRDTEFTFDKLQHIAELERVGVRLVAANPDLFHPGPGGRRVAETGALCSAIEAITGKPMEYLGKPHPSMFQYAMEVYKVDASQSVMVGDNLYTDISGGRQAGMKTIWIRGAGINQLFPDTTRVELMPDAVVERMDQLLSNYLSTLRSEV
jgi:HAD superfamily hydrolase (TIGR01450 family)